MTKESQSPKESSEEIDLGQLFKLIGNAFDRFFNFIVSIFKGLHKVILLLLIHFYKRFLWYVGVVVLGLIVGYVLDESSEKEYGAIMFIETNFNSTRQVYENVKELHQLAHEDKDYEELARRLNINTEEASGLKGFYIQPDFDENKIVEMYSDFYMHLDSLSRTEMNYEKYKSSLSEYNFKIHSIGVVSSNKNLYRKIEKGFINGLVDNPYLEALLEVNKENLKRQDISLLTQINKTDSLVDAYLKIRLKESDKEPVQGSGTNFYMGNPESNGLIVDESKIIEKRLDFEAERRNVYENLVKNQNVVNVISGFPKSGYDMSEWYDKMKFALPIALFTLTLIVFVSLGLANYLKEQNK